MDEASVPAESFAKAMRALDKIFLRENLPKGSPFPDCRSYTIEFGDASWPKRITLSDADIDVESESVIKFIRQHATEDHISQKHRERKKDN